MVVNKLQKGFSWELCPHSTSSNTLDRNCPERVTSVDTVTIIEPLVEWVNTFNMRQVTLKNLAENVNENNSTKIAIKAAKMHGRNVVNAAKSLDLLRQNIQSAINNDIDRVIKKYLDMYFVPAISNIRNNLGQGSVNEEHVRELCRTMLDEAKHLYLNSPLSRSDSPFNAASNINSLIESRFGNSQDDNEEEKNLYAFVKRRECEQFNTSSSQILTYKRKPMINVITPIINKNNPARIHSKTLFITSSRVNKVLGYGNMRGKLITKHPDLFRYSVDSEDKEWLIKYKLHYLSHNSLGPSYIMILEDIRELLNLDCYRNNPNVLRHELKGFEAPEFMLQKMRSVLSSTKIIVQNKEGLQSNVSLQNNSLIAVASSSPETNTIQIDDNTMTGVIQPTNVLIQVKDKKKIQKSNWTEDAMQKALRLISRGRSQRYVERKFGIPRRTLRNRLKIAASSRKNS